MRDKEQNSEKKQNSIKMIKSLEIEFENLRPFGDERDLYMFLNTHDNPSKNMCVIHKKAPRLFPKLASEPNNLITLCSNCVKEYIENFKEYRKIHRN